ncbi:hypothetical protein CYMTET_8684 [Cymbomonas tetramitiformis]|uniref:Uncharacterized protein n=1 Tax=Cymbomonas tetramitiformis TaxID=36881 RepID=A0AAE0GUC5_9CHLO|nr:hypothetical protein CYMTET_8684 [Cymbomonas tetramitiformis]
MPELQQKRQLLASLNTTSIYHDVLVPLRLGTALSRVNLEAIFAHILEGFKLEVPEVDLWVLCEVCRDDRVFANAAWSEAVGPDLFGRAVEERVDFQDDRRLRRVCADWVGGRLGVGVSPCPPRRRSGRSASAGRQLCGEFEGSGDIGEVAGPVAAGGSDHQIKKRCWRSRTTSCLLTFEILGPALEDMPEELEGQTEDLPGGRRSLHAAAGRRGQANQDMVAGGTGQMGRAVGEGGHAPPEGEGGGDRGQGVAQAMGAQRTSPEGASRASRRGNSGAALREATKGPLGEREGWTWSECERVILEIKVAAARQAGDLAQVQHEFGKYPAMLVEAGAMKEVAERLPECAARQQCGMEELHEREGVRARHLYGRTHLARNTPCGLERHTDTKEGCSAAQREGGGGMAKVGGDGAATPAVQTPKKECSAAQHEGGGGDGGGGEAMGLPTPAAQTPKKGRSAAQREGGGGDGESWEAMKLPTPTVQTPKRERSAAQREGGGGMAEVGRRWGCQTPLRRHQKEGCSAAQREGGGGGGGCGEAMGLPSPAVQTPKKGCSAAQREGRGGDGGDVLAVPAVRTLPALAA